MCDINERRNIETMQTKAFKASFDITQMWLKIAPKQHGLQMWLKIAPKQHRLMTLL